MAYLQDEFIYVWEGELTPVTEQGEQTLGSGVCAGFPTSQADGHQLIDCGQSVAVYLKVGDRLPGDRAQYPDEGLEARAVRGSYRFFRKDGVPYKSGFGGR